MESFEHNFTTSLGRPLGRFQKWNVRGMAPFLWGNGVASGHPPVSVPGSKGLETGTQVVIDSSCVPVSAPERVIPSGIADSWERQLRSRIRRSHEAYVDGT